MIALNNTVEEAENKKNALIDFMMTLRLAIGETNFIWLKSIIIYSLVFVLIFSVSNIIINFFDYYKTGPNSTLYLLSALIQSQAAIVAIVITMTLVAIQLTASSYSPRVIEIFKRNPDFWLLLVFYGLSISYSIIILKISDTYEVTKGVNYSIIFAFFTYAALIPYTYFLINLLKPSNIIDKLATNMKLNQMINKEDGDDYFQPIIDIIRNSFSGNDFQTSAKGMRTISDCTCEFLKKLNGDEEEKRLAVAIESHFTGIANLAFSRELQEELDELIRNIDKIGTYSAELKLEILAREMILLLNNIGIKSYDRDYTKTTYNIIKNAIEIGKISIKQDLDNLLMDSLNVFIDEKYQHYAYEILSGYEEISILAVNGSEKIYSACFGQPEFFPEDIERIIKNAIKEKSEHVVEKANLVLGIIADECAKNDRLSWYPWNTNSLETIIKIVAENDLDFDFHEIVEKIVITKPLSEKSTEEEIGNVAIRLIEAGYLASQKELEFTEQSLARALLKISYSNEDLINQLFNICEAQTEKENLIHLQNFNEIYEECRTYPDLSSVLKSFQGFSFNK